MAQQVLAGNGAGVQVEQLGRRVDEELIRTLRIEMSTAESLSSQKDFHARIMDAFGTPGSNTTLSHTLTEFQASLESLALEPQNTLDQREVARWGTEAAAHFERLTGTVQDLRREADGRVGQAVDELNTLTARMVELNRQTVRNEASGHEVADLKDERDRVINRMAELIDIRTFTRGTGEVVVMTAGGRTLVDEAAAQITYDPASNVGAAMTHAEGDFGGIMIGDPSFGDDLTGQIKSGALAGLIELRDETLPNLQSQLDELAGKCATPSTKSTTVAPAFPGAQELTGSTTFVNPGFQTMRLASGDVTIALFDRNGDVAANTTLDTIMQSPLFGSGAQGAGGPWSITEVANTLEDWFQQNGAPAADVSVAKDQGLSLNLNQPSLNVGFRDEAGTADGSDWQDVSIQFDSDANGFADQVVEGFSSFFGLNDSSWMARPIRSTLPRS